MYFLDHVAPAPFREARNRVLELRRSREDALVESVPTTMVMQEMATPRPTFLLARGQYDKPGERVDARRPGVAAPPAPGRQGRPAGLARWLVDPAIR